MKQQGLNAFPETFENADRTTSADVQSVQPKGSLPVRRANTRVVEIYRVDDVRRALLKRGVDPDKARDLAQGAVLKAMERPPQLRNTKAGTAYIISIAKRRLCTETRHPVEQLPEGCDPAAPCALSYETLIDIQKALACCSARQRRLVHLLYWEGLDARAAAVELNMTVAAAYVEISRARALMRERLSPAYASSR